LSNKQAASLFNIASLSQALDTAIARDRMGIDNVRPLRNLVDAFAVLALYSVADIGEFPVLEYQEVVLER